jgi:hypothetical protein
MLVTPGSVFLPSSADRGEGMPQRAIASFRLSGASRTIGAELSGKTVGAHGMEPYSAPA